MAIKFIAAAAAAATSLTMPAGRAIGDLELMFVFRSGSTTAPTIPSDWLPVGTAATTTSTWGGIYYRRCINASDTSGTFTSASGLACSVYRGVTGIGAIGTISAAVGTSVSFPAIASPIQSAGRSWFVGLAGHRTATAASMAVAPTGMTNRTGSTTALANIDDTNGGAASWSAQTITASASSGHVSNVVELLADNSTWNPYDTAGVSLITLSNANLTATSINAPANSNYIRGTLGKLTGRWVFMVNPSNLGPDNLIDCAVGVANASYTPLANSQIGSDANALRFNDSTAGTGFSFHFNGTNVTFAGPVFRSAGVKEYYAFDFDNLLAYANINGTWVNSAVPDSNTGGESFSGSAGPWYPILGMASTSDVAVFSGTDAGHGLTSFKTWDTVDLPVPVAALTTATFAGRLALGLKPGAGSLTITRYAPTVQVGGGPNIAVPKGTLALAGAAGRLGLGIKPGTGTLAISGKTASMAQNTPRPVPAGSVALSGKVGRLGLGVPVPVRALALSGQAARLGGKIPVPLRALSIGTAAPRSSIGLPLSVPVRALALASSAGRIGLGITPPARAVAVLGLAPRVGMNVHPGSGALALTGRAGALGLGLKPNKGAVVIGTYAATIQISAGGSITIPTAHLTAAGQTAAMNLRLAAVGSRALQISGKTGRLDAGLRPPSRALLLAGGAGRIDLKVNIPAKGLALATSAARLGLTVRPASVGLALHALTARIGLAITLPAGRLALATYPAALQGPISLMVRAGLLVLGTYPPGLAVTQTTLIDKPPLLGEEGTVALSGRESVPALGGTEQATNAAGNIVPVFLDGEI